MPVTGLLESANPSNLTVNVTVGMPLTSAHAADDLSALTLCADAVAGMARSTAKSTQAAVSAAFVRRRCMAQPSYDWAPGCPPATAAPLQRQAASQLWLEVSPEWRA